MRLLPVLAIVVLVPAAIIGFWLLSGEADPAGGEGATAGSADAVAFERTSGTEEATLEALDSLPESTADADRSVVETRPASVTTPAAKPVGTAITGRVVDEMGRPVEGADVTARHSVMSLGEHLVGVEATTGADGRFTVGVESSGDYSLTVGAPRYAPSHKSVSVASGETKDAGDLPLELGVILAGRVVDTNGAPVAGAILRRSFVPQSGTVLLSLNELVGGELAETDANGEFEIDRYAVGKWALTVRSEDHPNATAEGETGRPGERVDGIVVVLEDGFEISGRVVGIPADVGELVVRARPKDSSMSTMGPGIFIGSDDRSGEVAADGTFAVRGLRSDVEYLLRVRIASDDPLVAGSRSGIVEATAGDSGVEIEYEDGSALVFQVVDGKSGEPLTRFRVEAGLAWTRFLTGEDGNVLEEHEGGHVRFGGLRPEGEAGDAALVVTAVGYEDYEQEGIRVPAGEEVDLGVIRMTRTPVVNVVVREKETGEPVPNARVVLAEVAAPGNSRSVNVRRRFSIGGEDNDTITTGAGSTRSGRTDENGVCSLSSLPGVDCTISVRAAGFAPVKSPAVTLPAVGDYDYTADLSVGARIVVLARDAAGVPVAGAEVDHRTPDYDPGANMVLSMDDLHKRRTDSEGRVVFENLTPGVHSFRLVDKNPTQPSGIQFTGLSTGDEEEGWSDIAVDEGDEAELVLMAKERGSLSGIITESGEPLSGARVKLVSEDEAASHMPRGFGNETLAISDKTGRYEFEDVKLDSYTLEISHADRAMPFEYPVDVLGNDSRYDVDLPVSVVDGRIVDASGSPVEGISVQAKRAGGSSGPRAFAISITANGDESNTMISSGEKAGSTATTDKHGRYTLRGVEPDVDLVVEARGDNVAPASSDPFVVSAGDTRHDVDVTVTPAGKIAVNAIRADGTPVAGVLVRATFEGDAEGVDPKFTFIQTGGKTELTGLQEGPWRVTLSQMGTGSLDPNAGESRTIDVVAGEIADGTIEMP